MRIAALALTVALGLAAGGPASAQSRDETLADIRQELTVLNVSVQGLKRELSTTGGAMGSAGGGSALQRLDAIEEQLQRLTSKTEELEHRIQTVVDDGTRRIGDLEFRLVELEGGDVSKLGQTSTLGDGSVSAAPAPMITPAPDAADGMELAIGERADFEAGKAALEAGQNAKAAEIFARFGDTYPGSPLSGEAQFLRGEALSASGDTSQAARAYLESFSGSPSGPRASAALLKLGLALKDLGQTREACVTLGEVRTRFSGAGEAQQAGAAMASAGCN
ncbi:tol-pal system protein YbgF [Rhodovulum viride]|uniref:Cell division coordinator CpoB n=1 Tax=Rhodovulum viride TaxID=1231134 RepID=A0ABX9DJP3_9RHOB|nr:tol-pal system protein YbgF [Rhodovulum viride]RAP42601.1 tol-pal system protein YbgF [Rhodovulum viride]